jgi:biotin synthase
MCGLFVVWTHTGRLSFTPGEQALLFLAGANSIFNGDKLLTTPNPEFDEDKVGI